MNEEYMNEYEALVDETFPLIYAYYVSKNGYSNPEWYSENRYRSIEKLPKHLLKIVKENEGNAEILKKVLAELDEFEIDRAKDWAEDTRYEHRGFPMAFSIVRENGYGKEDVIYEDNQVSEESRDDYYGESYVKSFKNFMQQLEEADLGTRHDIPLDAEREIKIRFFEGETPIENLCIDANSLRDLADKTEHFNPSFGDYISGTYFGVDPNTGDHYFSAGWVLEDWIDNVWDRLKGQWKDNFEDKDYQSGTIRLRALNDPASFKSKWITRAVEIDGHTALFESADIYALIERLGGDTSKITFDNNEAKPTAAELNISETPYYQEDEIRQISPTVADWETTADHLFPIGFVICEDGDPDMDFCFDYDTPEEFIEWAKEEIPVMDTSDFEKLVFEGKSRNSIKKMLSNWMDVLISRLQESVLKNTAENYDEEDMINYRWLSFILHDKAGRCFYFKNVDMASILKGLNIEVPNSIMSIEEPEEPRRMY